MFSVYEVQLNAYAYIARQIGFTPISKVSLIYMEPVTEFEYEEVDNLMSEEGFSIVFKATLKPVELKTGWIEELLKQVREIYDKSTPPPPTKDCKNCMYLDTLFKTGK